MLNAKRLMSVMLILAMIVTMASFPTFAAEEKINLSADNITIGAPEKGTVEALFDGKTESTSLYVIKNTYIGGSTIGTTPASANTIIIDLGANYDLSTLNLYWGTTAWGQQGPDAYTLYTAPAAAEGEEPVYTKVTNYDGLNAKVQAGQNGKALADHSNITVVKYNKTHETFDVTEDFTGVTARYIKILLEKNVNRVGLREIEAYGTKILVDPVEYTIKYVDEEDASIKADFVDKEENGATVTATAPEIDGYYIENDADKTQSITLDKAVENVITFTYKKYPDRTYTATYVDENGNPVAASTTGTVAWPYEAEIKAVYVDGYYTPAAVTKTITDTDNTVEFVYEKTPDKMIATPDNLLVNATATASSEI